MRTPHWLPTTIRYNEIKMFHVAITTKFVWPLDACVISLFSLSFSVKWDLRAFSPKGKLRSFRLTSAAFALNYDTGKMRRMFIEKAGSLLIWKVVMCVFGMATCAQMSVCKFYPRSTVLHPFLSKFFCSFLFISIIPAQFHYCSMSCRIKIDRATAWTTIQWQYWPKNEENQSNCNWKMIHDRLHVHNVDGV